MGDDEVPWRTFVARFARLGLLGFGGPPNHVVIMREQWVGSGTVGAQEFSDAFAAVSLLPGPASTQLAMWLGWRTRGYRGLLVAAALFVVPAVVMVLVLSRLVLGGSSSWLVASALGAGAVVPAVALRAGIDVARGYRLDHASVARRWRIGAYGALGALACVGAPGALVAAIVAGGLCEVVVSRASTAHPVAWLSIGPTKAALAWTALKVGALSFGGGFVIVPIMRGDAVSAHHWLTASAFATAVAIGQLTPGPVVATVAAVGFAAAGWSGGVVAAAIAFAPSLVFVGLGARHLGALRGRPSPRAFLDGAGPVATGAIAASAVVLARGCVFAWQWPLVALGLVAVVALRRSPTLWLVGGAAIGLLAQLVWHVRVA